MEIQYIINSVKSQYPALMLGKFFYVSLALTNIMATKKKKTKKTTPNFSAKRPNLVPPDRDYESKFCQKIDYISVSIIHP